MSDVSRVGGRESCSCDNCQSACRHRPGWFKPGEVKDLADALDISLQELFDTRLAVDWWEATGDLPETFVLAPAVEGSESGEMYPPDPRSRCTFFDGDGCEIHNDGKPFECREYFHSDPKSKSRSDHKEAAEAWNTPGAQELIRELLGEEPESKRFTGGTFGGLHL